MLALLGGVVVVLMDWRAVRMGLDLDGTYFLVALWGGAMLVPIALLLVLLCVCFVGRGRKTVALWCFILGLLAAAAFAVSAPFYQQAIATLSTNNMRYQPAPWLTALGKGKAGANPDALALATAIAACVLPLLALWTLPEISATPVELRGLRGVRARLRTLRGSLVLNPVRLVFGPIFQRDVRITGRHRSTYVFRALYPAMLLGITVIAYVGMTQSLNAAPSWQQVQGGRVAELQALQRLAPQLTNAIAGAQFVLLMLLAPVLTAPALCEEKRARTLGSLLTTPLSNLQIVLGKLSSRMVHVVILVAASTPLLLAARVFGGVDAEVIVAVLAITLTAALMGAAMGIHFSVTHKRAATAAIGGIISTGALMLLPVAGLGIYAMQFSRPPTSPVAFGLSAPIAMAFVLFGPPGVGVDPTKVWLINCAVNLIVTAVVCLSSAAALRRVMLREVVDEGAALKAMTARARRRAAKAAARAATAPAVVSAEGEALRDVGAPAEAPAREIEIASGSRTVSDRPVLWRELRQSTLGSRFKLIVAILGVLLCGAFLYSRMSIWDESLHMAVACVAIFALCLQASVASTAAIGAERESQSWETLMTTPLTGRQILMGKYLGALKRMWLPAAVLVLHFGMSLVRGYVHPIAVAEVFALAIGAPAMLCATGLLLSLLFKRATAAAVMNLGFAAALWIGAPMLGAFCLNAFGINGKEEDAVMGFFVCSNPVAMAFFSLSGAVESVPWRMSPPIYNDFPWEPVTMWEFAVYVGVGFAVALTVAGGCLALCERLFPRVSGRSS